MASPAKLRWRAPGVSTGPIGGGGSGGGGGLPIPAEYFGIHIGGASPTTVWADYDPKAGAAYIQTPWPAIGAKTIRLWDANGANWRNIERSRGVYSWDRLDFYLAMAKAQNAKVIFTLGSGPDWATAPNYGQTYYQQPSKPIGWYVGYNPFPPAADSDWLNWCTAVATRIKNAGFPGAAYEIWNECNDTSYGATAVGSGYAGTVQRLVELTSLARTAVKAVDPTAIIVAANFTGIDGVTAGDHPNLESYIDAGGMLYADVVSIHGYNTASPWTRPEGIIAFANIINGLLKTRTITKPVWNTEWGWGGWCPGQAGQKPFRSSAIGTPSPDPMPDSLAADYMTRMILLNWLVGFRRLAYYAIDAFHWASQRLFEPADHLTFKPGATAYAYASSLLIGGYLSGLNKAVSAGTEYYRANFTTAAGRVGYAIWCDEYDAASVSIPGAVEVRSNVGTVVQFGAALAVTGSPKFIFLS